MEQTQQDSRNKSENKILQDHDWWPEHFCKKEKKVVKKSKRTVKKNIWPNKSDIEQMNTVKKLL